jgi:tuberous sclerosis protein 1
MLFNRLYGMYPCNFIDYIRNEFILKTDKTPIFNHTIRGLLDTVKIHPNLISSTKVTEISASRFKKMEPHDVVVECAKYSIESEKVSSNNTSGFLECTNFYPSSMKPLEYTHLIVDPLPPLPARNYLASANSVENKFESLWSPSLVIQATPPPTTNTNLNLPNTPTPTPVPFTPNYNIKNAQSMMVDDNDDASREAAIERAIEATPETTPIKPEIRNTFRPYSNSPSQTARNIWPKSSSTSLAQNVIARSNTSTPSSPMKRNEGKFIPSSSSSQQVQLVQQHPQIPLDFTNNQKLMRILSDRENSSTTTTTATAAEAMNISREDQEVNDINTSFNVNTSDQDVFNTNMVDYDDNDTDPDDNENADTTPPLYNRVDYVRRVKRLRLYSHCICSAGTSPADSINYMPRIPSSGRLKRYNSWPNLKQSDVVINSTKLNKKADDSENQQSSSDEAVSAVSHFKEKTTQNGDISTLNNKSNSNSNINNNSSNISGSNSNKNGSIFKKIKEDLKTKPLELVQKSTNGTQTIEPWPTAYETMFYNFFGEDLKKKQQQKDESEIVTVTQQSVTTSTTTTTTKTTIMKSNISQSSNQISSPNEMIDQYIQTSLKRKNSSDYRDHIELLAIQLQFEKHRREIHAERNRRLLGKTRQRLGLEQSNATLSDQVSRLSAEINSLNKRASETRNSHLINVRKLEETSNFWARKCSEEAEKNKILQREKEILRMQLDEELNLKKQALMKIDSLSAENFDLKNLYEDARQEAERGKQYRDQLKKLESDIIIFNEARLKCQQQMEELSAMKVRDVEMELTSQSYLLELQDMKRNLDIKASQIDNLKSRLCDYEQQIQKKDASLADQKRLIKSIKDVYEEKFKVI